MSECSELIYKRDLSQLVLATLHKNRREDFKDIFCSELVAAALKSMQFLNGNCSNFLPVDFCPSDIPLNGCSFGPMHRLVLDPSKSRSIPSDCSHFPKSVIPIGPVLETKSFRLTIVEAKIMEQELSDKLFAKITVSRREGISKQKALHHIPTCIRVSLHHAPKHSSQYSKTRVGLHPQWNDSFELWYYTPVEDDPLLRLDIMTETIKAPFSTLTSLGTVTLNLSQLKSICASKESMDYALESPKNSKLFARLNFSVDELNV